MHLVSMADKCRSGTTKKIKITCQQVGIVTDPDQIVSNAPEGIHQDGCDYIVSASVIEIKLIIGGQSVVFGPDKSMEYLHHTLQDGQAFSRPIWDQPYGTLSNQSSLRVWTRPSQGSGAS